MLRKYPKYIIAFVSIVIFAVTVYIFYSRESNRDMEIRFLSVGQGDSVLITSPNGNRLLYDAGPSDRKILQSLEEELSIFDRKIDIFIASHPDADHIGGFEDVLSKVKPKYYIDGHTINLSPLFYTLEKKINSMSIERITARKGSFVDLGGGVMVYFLTPTQDLKKESMDTNDASVSILVKYGSSKILLTGDLEEKEELKLVDFYGSGLKSNIFKAGHHGSKSSNTQILLGEVKPDFFVVSAGLNNKYGHPSESAISRVRVVGSKILETSKIGTVKFSCTKDTCRNTN